MQRNKKGMAHNQNRKQSVKTLSEGHACMLNLLVTLWTAAARLPWSRYSMGKNTGVSCHALLQGIFPSQGSNLGLPHFKQILYHMSHQESP